MRIEHSDNPLCSVLQSESGVQAECALPERLGEGCMVHHVHISFCALVNIILYYSSTFTSTHGLWNRKYKLMRLDRLWNRVLLWLIFVLFLLA